MRKRIYKELQAIGAKQAITGFDYLVQAIEIQCDENTRIKKYTDLYAVIAKDALTTPSRVERSIRHEIEIIFADTRKTEEQLLDIFGTTDKPCNSEFIACMANYLTM